MAGEVRPAAAYSLSFNGLTDDGRALASGIYFARFESGQHTQVDKLTLVK